MTSAAPERLRIGKFVRPEGFYHVARHVRAAGHHTTEHTHDFDEVFWVERGGALHRINGQTKALHAGDLVLMRAPDTHGFRVAGQAGTAPVFSLVNVAFRRAHLAYLKRRYFGGDEAAFPWRGAELPARYRLGPNALRRLAELADALARGPQSLLRLESFLLELLELATAAAPASARDFEDLPEWLRAAQARFAGAERLAGGVREFVKLTGRGPEHVNRTVRRCLGQTTTDFVNGLRLEYAARELSMSARPILELALDAGFENLSYFYRLFVRRYGQTPRRYRRHSQMLVR
ncbi:MAG: helix-turn-helix transcriptional regulator [Planctomycetota bacterium]|nr:helix-turn-helix transcriptional regulator [Planctomycetota bacterium]